MSRNVRKNPTTIIKVVKRRRRDSDSSSSLDLSDDGGYSGVDDVSDSEDDDEEDVEAAEAEHIIDRALHPKHSAAPPRPDDEDEDDEEADNEEEQDEEADDDQDDDDDAESNSSWNGIMSEADDSSVLGQPVEHDFLHKEPPVERHVRFAGVPDSDSDSTTSDVSDHNGDFFPDIFVEQTSLDPAFRREIEHDPDDSSNSGSFWDFHEAYETVFNSPGVVNASDDDTPVATPATSRVVSEASTPVPDDYQELDGYETDGDTTEEDVPDPPIRRKLPRRVQPVEVSSDSDTEKPTKPRRRGKPRVGRFDLDSSETKPIAVVNPISRKMMIFTPQRLRRLDLSPESFNLDNMDFFAGNSMLQASPILSNSGTLMFGAMFSSNTFGDFMNSQPVGPAEAFFSTTSDAFADDSDMSEMDASEEDEAEKSLKIEDFVTFEETDSADEGEAKDANPWEDDTNDDAMSTPGRRPSTAASAFSESNADVHPLFAHFDSNSDAVGAFRRNQVNQQLILSDKATKESLLFSNAYSMGTIRGVRSDSLNNVAAPLTPARRRKQTMDMYGGLQSSPLESVSQKRKASSGVGEATHKRHRSISDVQSLQI